MDSNGRASVHLQGGLSVAHNIMGFYDPAQIFLCCHGLDTLVCFFRFKINEYFVDIR